ncbi:MAG: hypothetical protein ACMUIP_12670 [bacterium]
MHYQITLTCCAREDWKALRKIAKYGPHSPLVFKILFWPIHKWQIWKIWRGRESVQLQITFTDTGIEGLAGREHIPWTEVTRAVLAFDGLFLARNY